MLAAFLWGIGAAASLVIGALLVLRWNIPRRVIGLVMAFGVGVLISAVSFELVDEAIRLDENKLVIALGFVFGSLTFFTGNILLEKIGNGRGRRSKTSGSPLAIFMGTALDGIPESIVLGLGLVGGKTVSFAMLVAIFMSNLPEAVASTSDLKKDGWRSRTILIMWAVVVLCSGIASAIGFSLFNGLPPLAAAFTMTFAGGALLTMLADAMMPEAYRNTGSWAGVITACGFGVAYWLSRLAG